MSHQGDIQSQLLLLVLGQPIQQWSKGLLGGVLITLGFHNRIPHTEWLKYQEFIYGGWKSKMKELVGLVSGETFLLGLQMATFLLHPHMTSFLCVYLPKVSSSSLRTLGVTLIASLKFLILKSVPWEVRAKHTYLWGGHMLDHIRGHLLDASSTVPVGAATGCQVLFPASSVLIWMLLDYLCFPEMYQK